MLVLTKTEQDSPAEIEVRMFQILQALCGLRSSLIAGRNVIEMSTGPKLSDSPTAAERTPVYTIGYGARTLDDFISALKTNRIEYLVDVRSAPYSKFKPEFSKDWLQRHLEQVGIRYLFMGDMLGGQPKDPSCHTEGKVDYEKVRAQPFFHAGLERVKKAFQRECRVALMCSEGRPEQCHRSKLIGEVLSEEGVPVLHIDHDGELVTQRDVIGRLTQGQMDLFGGPSFTSRKRYGPRIGEEEGQ
jgi:uncharacterized protein (DUF488 family)